MCRLYVSYVRRVNDVITGGESARGTVIQAFEFAITKVGLDIHSGDLWNDYLDFLKGWTPAASWEQQQKVDLIRKVYKRYLAIPTTTIETAWQQYAQWENQVNATTALKFIAEKLADFMLARSWNTEWHRLTENRLSRLICVGDAAQDQTMLWLMWIDFEKKNSLECKDSNMLQQRIQYVFRVATHTLPFVSQLWFKFTKYWLVTDEEAHASKCIELLKRARALNPKSLLLAFQLAELQEKDGPFDHARDTYLDLFANLNREYGALASEIAEIESLVHLPQNDANGNENPDGDESEGAAKAPDTVTKTKLTREESVRVSKLRPQQAELNKLITLVYSKLMVASRRCSGIKEARQVFKQGRKAFPDIGYAFFVQNAYLEHYADNKKIAMRIFDLASKARDFSVDGHFLLQYFDYLVCCNEVDALRKLVQTSDANFAKEIGALEESLTTQADEGVKQQTSATIARHKNSLRRLLMAYVAYASTYLSLDTVHSFSTKYEQLFPQDDPVLLFANRYCADKENVVLQLEWQGDEPSMNEEEPRLKRRKIARVPTGPAEMAAAPARPAAHAVEVHPVASEPAPRVGPLITGLLRELPNASYFAQGSDSVFDPEKLTQLFANLPNVHPGRAG